MRWNTVNSSHGQLVVWKFQKSGSDTRTKKMFYMLICNQVTLNLTLTLILTRERTIIGSVSYRNWYWVYRIESYRLLLYRPILCASLQVHQLLMGRNTHDDQRAFKCPVTRPQRTQACVLFYGPWYRTGLDGRKAEGDCTPIPASPWHKDGAVLVLATITLHSLHQQEVITTVSCQSL